MGERRRSYGARGSIIATNGVTMGSALAMILSYSINSSILWAMAHGLLSWIYVIYFAIAY